MKMALATLVILASSMASAAQISGKVSKLQVNESATVKVTLDNGATADIDSCSYGSNDVTSNNVSDCLRNQKIFSLLQASLTNSLRVTIITNGGNNITDALLSK